MMIFNLKYLALLSAAVTSTALSAATPAIGVAMSQGNILVDHSRTAGNATVFDGNTLQTETMASQIRLKDGAVLRLESASRAQIFSDHADLQEGSARVSGYTASANGLSVRTESTGSANVAIHGKVVEIAALTGNVHVFNAAGINVANLLPGRALNLTPADAGASAASSLTGCVRGDAKKNLFLTDQTTNVTVQLKGRGVKVGRLAQVSGSMVPNSTPVAGASQVLNVTSVQDKGACSAAQMAAAGAGAAGAGAAGAAGGAAAGATAGTTAGITATVVGVSAVAVGAGLGIAAGAGAFSTTSSSTP